jgi:predicted CopG family antitoxin
MTVWLSSSGHVQDQTGLGVSEVLASSEVDRQGSIVHASCMGKTITIDDQAYQLLSSLKQGKRDSFSQVIHRNIARKANTCGELEDAYQDASPPNIDLEVLDRMLKERGRRSGGRK